MDFWNTFYALLYTLRYARYKEKLCGAEQLIISYISFGAYLDVHFFPLPASSQQMSACLMWSRGQEAFPGVANRASLQLVKTPTFSHTYTHEHTHTHTHTHTQKNVHSLYTYILWLCTCLQHFPRSPLYQPPKTAPSEGWWLALAVGSLRLKICSN